MLQSKFNKKVQKIVKNDDSQKIGFYILKDNNIIDIKLRGIGRLDPNKPKKIFVDGLFEKFEYKISDFPNYDLEPVINIEGKQYGLTLQYIKSNNVILFKLKEEE